MIAVWPGKLPARKLVPAAHSERSGEVEGRGRQFARALVRF